MGEIIDHIAQDTQSKENENTRKRYKGVCPVCGKENWICNPERQEMDLERFEDYEKSQKARDDVDKIAGNLGYGGQDNG